MNSQSSGRNLTPIVETGLQGTYYQDGSESSESVEERERRDSDIYSESEGRTTWRHIDEVKEKKTREIDGRMI